MPLYATHYFFLFRDKLFFMCHLYYPILLLFLLYLWRHRNIHINYHVHEDRSYMVCIYTPTYKTSIVRGKVCHNYNNTCQKWKSPKIKTAIWDLLGLVLTQLVINFFTIPKRHYINRAMCVSYASCISLATSYIWTMYGCVISIPNERRFGTHLIYIYD